MLGLPEFLILLVIGFICIGGIAIFLGVLIYLLVGRGKKFQKKVIVRSLIAVILLILAFPFIFQIAYNNYPISKLINRTLGKKLYLDPIEADVIKKAQDICRQKEWDWKKADVIGTEYQLTIRYPSRWGERDSLSINSKTGELESEFIVLEKDKDGTSRSLYKAYLKDGGYSEVLIKNGKSEGPQRSYYANGQLKSEMFFKNGELDGPSRSYYANGQLKSEMFSKNGKLHGVERRYDENGRLIREVTWVNGEVVSSWNVWDVK